MDLRFKVNNLLKIILYYALLLVGIGIISILPVLISITAGSIAQLFGCPAGDEGSASVCMINGKDYGGVIYGFGLAGWFTFMTIPVGGILFIAWLISLLYKLYNLAKS